MHLVALHRFLALLGLQPRGVTLETLKVYQQLGPRQLSFRR